jgi:hypothetical protein
MRRHYWLLFLIFIVLCAFTGGPFKKTYKDAALNKVLQDIETHFSLQIIYRPQDLAGIPAFSGTINTTDFQTALRQVLGKRLKYTIRKNIIVITPETPQSSSNTSPPKSNSSQTPAKSTAPKPASSQASATAQAPKSTPVQSPAKSATTNITQLQASATAQTPKSTPAQSTAKTETLNTTYSQVSANISSAEQAQAQVSSNTTTQQTSQPQSSAIEQTPKFTEEQIQPSVSTSQSEQSQISQDQIFSLPPFLIPSTDTITSIQPLKTFPKVRLPQWSSNPNMRLSLRVNHNFRHLFQPAISLGYGSELMTQLDLRYVYCFHRNWGIGAGLNFAFAAQKSSASDSLAWRQEGRIGFPFTLVMRYKLSRLWGLHASLGATASFMVYSGKSGTGISGKSVDVLPFLEVDALYPLTAHTELLFGLYTHISAISVSPWSVGLHLGIVVGK